MSIVTVSTPFNIDLEFRIAPFHKRLVAWLIDIVIVYAFAYIMYRVLVSNEDSGYLSNVLYILLVILPYLLYHLLFEVFMNGQSLGKKTMGIKVMDKNGNEPTLSQYLLRWMFRLVDMLGTLGTAAVLSAALTTYTQRLGDLVAGTMVIDQRYAANFSETIYMPIEDKGYKPLFPQVMQLSDRDINGIRNLLDIKSSSRDVDLYTLQVTDRIKEVLNIETDMDARQFLYRLLQDYNFLTRK
ncbi:MAG TPA: RDD family protein [Flavipsychrobacter sp.]|nr:RDD family protein [Flavipsychrobacter sp.]